MGETDKRRQGLNFKQKIVVVWMDLMFLIELTFAIYLGQQNPEYITAIFLRSFIPLALATLIVARILMRRLRTADIIDGDPSGGAENRGGL